MNETHVLIVDDDRALAQAIAARCRALGLFVRTSPDPVHAACEICWVQPKMLIMDVGMPGTDGLTLCERLTRDGHLDSTRVVVLTGRSDADTINACARMGVRYVLKGANVWNTLQPLIVDTLGLGQQPAIAPAPEERVASAPEAPTDDLSVVAPSTAVRATPRAPKVLSIDDDIAISTALRLRLRPLGVEVVCAANATDGFLRALQEEPDVIITDFRMPEAHGDYLLHRLKSHPLTSKTPVIVLSGHGTGRNDGGYDRGLEREMLRHGAAAYLPKPLDFSRLCEVLAEHIMLQSAAPNVNGAAARSEQTEHTRLFAGA